jgi:ATP-dependent Clp protease protease subunit
MIKLQITSFHAWDVIRLQRAIDKCVNREQDALPIVINSPGGSITHMMAMVDIMQAAPIPISTVAVGMAASAGAELLSAGAQGARFVAPNAVIMVHQGSFGAYGKTCDVVNNVEAIRLVEQRSIELLDKNCGKRKGYWRKVFKERGNTDFFMTAEEAITHGLADHVGLPQWAVQASRVALIMPKGASAS